MEVKILDSILHGALKPWKFDINDSKRIIALVKATKAGELQSIDDLTTRLKTLLKDYPALVDEIKQGQNDLFQILPMPYKIELPKYGNPATNFYQLIISGESLRIFNEFVYLAEEWTELVDLRFQISKMLTNIRVLARQTVIELQEQGFTHDSDLNENITYFALYNLKQCLIQLYFSIQEHFKESLETFTSLEDFYLLDLEEVNSELISLEAIEPNTYKIGIQDRINFGFRGNIEKLTQVVNQLCYQVELINEDVNDREDLLKVLTSSSLTPGCTKIQLGCETKRFRYIIDKLDPHFKNLALATIEKSQIFYSKKDTLITANNLSASSSKNKLEPKEKTTIDKIFQQMQ